MEIEEAARLPTVEMMIAKTDECLKMIHRCNQDNDRLRALVECYETDAHEYRQTIRDLEKKVLELSVKTSQGRGLSTMMESKLRREVSRLSEELMTVNGLWEDDKRRHGQQVEALERSLEQERMVKQKILKDVSELASTEDYNKKLVDEFGSENKLLLVENEHLKKVIEKLEAEQRGAKEKHALELKFAKEMYMKQSKADVPVSGGMETKSQAVGLMNECILDCLEAFKLIDKAAEDLADCHQPMANIALKSVSSQTKLMVDELEARNETVSRVVSDLKSRLADVMAIMQEQTAVITDMRSFIEESTAAYESHIRLLEHKCDAMAVNAVSAVDDIASRFASMQNRHKAVEARDLESRYLDQQLASKEKVTLITKIEDLMDDVAERESLIDCMNDELKTLRSRLTLEEATTKACKNKEKVIVDLKRENQSLIKKLETICTEKSTVDTGKLEKDNSSYLIRKMETELSHRDFEIKELGLELEIVRSQLISKQAQMRLLEQKVGDRSKGEDKENRVTQTALDVNRPLRLEINIRKDRDGLKAKNSQSVLEVASHAQGRREAVSTLSDQF